ncbi:RPII140 upstream locus tag protein [Echinococcus multilocularis]|uniref:RPII140 upstream locus tag protein n=1 Tax=Echinococcus multilocularis TaxID=6211 RepID=A0A068YBX7_ECHMU|nr:RPII140 upstream locus tag protein [Echinococcus multilocularis]
MATDVLSDQDQEVLGQTLEDIDSSLSYRDEMLTGKCGAGGSKGGLAFAPPMLDGATLLFSRYGRRDTPMFRVIDTIWIQDSDESDLATVSRSLRRLPFIAGFLAGTTASCICVPGIFNEFTKSNQLTLWRTREMAKRQAFDHVMWTATKLAIGVGIKSCFLTAGFLYLPFLVSAYRGRTSFWEHGACFGATLAVFCLPRGPVPALVGSVVGLGFGALYGSVYYLVARTCGYTFEQLYERRF